MHIALLGDSTIDNVVWTGAGNEVAAQLRASLQQDPESRGARVSNLAADGFTSSKVLRGGVPSISLVKREQAGDAFPSIDDDGIFRPLETLEFLDPPPTHAVISIGGNDVKAILGSLHRLEQVMKDFQQNYSSIVDRMCRTVPKVVLMFQYRPCLHMDDSYGVYRAMGSLPGPGDSVSKLNHLMEQVYNPILAIASKQHLPVIDLPRSFNIEDESLYRCQIEPSAAGGSLITDLISHVVCNHDFAGTSMLYLRQSGAVRAEINNGDGSWSIPQSTSTLNAHDQKDCRGSAEEAVAPNFFHKWTRCVRPAQTGCTIA